jgi:hypothetical protein
VDVAGLGGERQEKRAEQAGAEVDSRRVERVVDPKEQQQAREPDVGPSRQAPATAAAQGSTKPHV